MKLVKESLLEEDKPDLKFYIAGNIKNEFLISVTNHGKPIGGLYAGKPNSGEDLISVMKVAIVEEARKKGIGPRLYLVAMALLGNKGLTPHRRKGNTTPAAANIWKYFSSKDFIKKTPLEKIYDDKELSKFLDFKYTLDKSKRKEIIKSEILINQKISDPFDKSSEPNKTTLEIIDKEM